MGIFEVRRHHPISPSSGRREPPTPTPRRSTYSVRQDGAFSFCRGWPQLPASRTRFDDARVRGQEQRPRRQARTASPCVCRASMRLSSHYRAGRLTARRREISAAGAPTVQRRSTRSAASTSASPPRSPSSSKLANFGRDRIECEVVSLVDHPHELVDTYGRVVANIRVGKQPRPRYQSLAGRRGLGRCPPSIRR